MTEDRPSELLGALPRSRPHRRSDKRPARATAAAGTETAKKATSPDKPATRRQTASPAAPKAKAKGSQAKAPRPEAKTSRSPAKAPRAAAKSPPRRLPQPAQPRGVPRGKPGARPEPKTEFPVLRTAVQAAAELTEIGVTLSAKAIRGALGRLPRP